MIGIRTGLNTQNQCQSIYPVNFKTINTMVNRPKNPTPPLLDELLIHPPIKSYLTLAIYKASHLVHYQNIVNNVLETYGSSYFDDFYENQDHLTS